MPEFNDFRNGVFSLYDLRKSQNQLDSRLANPTPASLRKYCLIRLSQNLPNTDIEILKDFFDPLNKSNNFEKTIDEYPLGKLRALQKLIIERTEEPDEKLVKLLAILIDYQPRPFKYNYHDKSIPPVLTDPVPPTIKVPEPPEIVEPAAPVINIPKTVIGSKNWRQRLPFLYGRNRHAIRFSASVCFLMIIFYIIYSLTPKGCMYWDEYKYVETDCQSSIPANRIVGFNKDQFNTFFKIMRPDTLSKKDVGFVWYSKIDNEVEFFTRSGHHPIEIKKGLKLATEHIIETYAGKNAKKAR
ncbi:hypothetical protein [Sphingobacterium detergens]|uniref:hypothetical protein n=1 Tax=Sphingobacterium detergens TaxID=1145106 RepID=UPI003AAFB652